MLDLAGLPLPDDRVYDGHSLAGTWLRNEKSPRHTVYYYHGRQLYAVRHRAHKLHFTTKTEYAGQEPVHHDPPLLFQLEEDPGERHDIAAQYPEIVEEISRLAEEHRQSFDPPPTQLEARSTPDSE